MDALTRVRLRTDTEPVTRVDGHARRRWLAVALFVLGVGSVANSLLGPLVADVINYPFSESVWNQTIGLEAVTLFLVAPLCLFAGILAVRGHRAAAPVAFGPAAYTAYMFLQYVIGPEYDHYPGVLPLHLAMFILGAGIAAAAWGAIDLKRLPDMAHTSKRRYGIVLLALAAFVVCRYLPALFAGLRGEPLTAEFRTDVSMYWSIFLLDLGIVVPATIAAGAALIRGTPWGPKPLYAIFGWFALVPPSVAAMAIVMVVNEDPNGSTSQAIMLTVAAVAFAALAVWVYRPLFDSDRRFSERT